MITSVSQKTAISLLQQGGVGVLPTDTVYGLVAKAHNPQAVARLYKLKSREHKPGTIVAASVEQLQTLGVPREYLTKVSHLWPNPLSIIIPLDTSLGYLHQDTGSGAFRVVADRSFRDILLQTGPLLTSSANQPGKPPATTTKEAWNYFHNTVDFYVDGGDLSNREPSTIIRISSEGNIEVIRQGAATLEPNEGLPKL